MNIGFLNSARGFCKKRLTANLKKMSIGCDYKIFKFIPSKNYTEILRGVAELMPSTIDLVSSNRVGDYRQDCLLLCDSHVILVLQNEAHFDCTSEEEDNDLIVDELGRSFCNSCVTHYVKKTLDIFPYENY